MPISNYSSDQGESFEERFTDKIDPSTWYYFTW